MKKLFLLSSMLLLTSGLFANEIIVSETVLEADIASNCCRRNAVDEEGDVLVSVTVCTEGSLLANCIAAEDELDRWLRILAP